MAIAGWATEAGVPVVPLANAGPQETFLVVARSLGGSLDFGDLAAFEQDDPDYDWHRFDFDRDAPKLEAMSALLRPTADLRAFRDRALSRTTARESQEARSPGRPPHARPPPPPSARGSSAWSARRSPRSRTSST